MSWNQFLEGEYNNKSALAIILAVLCSVFIGIGLLILAVHFLLPGTQNENTKNATAAARQHIPDATVSKLKVSGGFAVAIVSDPAGQDQSNAGNSTIFKVNKDGSMTQIAVGSSFSPVDLLNLGIPLSTQATLVGHSLYTVKSNLADICGYTGDNNPGYSGFNASFQPGGWQIDSGTLDGLEHALTTNISSSNTLLKTDQKTICVNATPANSKSMTDPETYISTFSLDLQFITSDGVIGTHTFTFSIGPQYYRSYALDGKNIE